jgi:outer membrane receptor protein involved in Fe transport
VGGGQVINTNLYYKAATDMLDDTQLLNTAIATPYNYAKGYAYGLELSVKGKITPELSDFFNYSYDIAKGENISGGSFAFSPSSPATPGNTYIFLDHVQLHTANYGLSYSKDNYFGSVQGLYGSGLRTGPFNTASLPDHFTYDLTAGYQFARDSWISKWKVQGDILNIFNNVYPITIANGFNGSHYAAGREFFIRLTKEL